MPVSKENKDFFADFTSRDESAAVACLNHNHVVYNECVDGCNGERCEFECGQAYVEDLKSCPCYDYCHAGCSNCNSSFCKCNDPSTDPEYIDCQERVNF